MSQAKWAWALFSAPFFITHMLLLPLWTVATAISKVTPQSLAPYVRSLEGLVAGILVGLMAVHYNPDKWPMGMAMCGNVFANQCFDHLDDTLPKGWNFPRVAVVLLGEAGAIFSLVKVKDLPAERVIFLNYCSSGVCGWAGSLAFAAIQPRYSDTLAPGPRSITRAWVITCLFSWFCLGVALVAANKRSDTPAALVWVLLNGSLVFFKVALRTMQGRAFFWIKTVAAGALFVAAEHYDNHKDETHNDVWFWLVWGEMFAAILTEKTFFESAVVRPAAVHLLPGTVMTINMNAVAGVATAPLVFAPLGSPADSVTAASHTAVSPFLSNQPTIVPVNLFVNFCPREKDQHYVRAAVDSPGSLHTVLPASWLHRFFPTRFPSPPPLGPQRMDIDFPILAVRVRDAPVEIVEDGTPVLGLSTALALVSSLRLTFTKDGDVKHAWPEVGPWLGVTCPGNAEQEWMKCVACAVLPGTGPLRFRVDGYLAPHVNLLVGRSRVARATHQLYDCRGSEVPIALRYQAGTVHGKKCCVGLAHCALEPEEGLAGWVSLQFLVAHNLGGLTPGGLFEAYSDSPIVVSNEDAPWFPFDFGSWRAALWNPKKPRERAKTD